MFCSASSSAPRGVCRVQEIEMQDLSFSTPPLPESVRSDILHRIGDVVTASRMLQKLSGGDPSVVVKLLAQRCVIPETRYLSGHPASPALVALARDHTELAEFYISKGGVCEIGEGVLSIEPTVRDCDSPLLTKALCEEWYKYWETQPDLESQYMFLEEVLLRGASLGNITAVNWANKKFLELGVKWQEAAKPMTVNLKALDMCFTPNTNLSLIRIALESAIRGGFSKTVAALLASGIGALSENDKEELMWLAITRGYPKCVLALARNGFLLAPEFAIRVGRLAAELGDEESARLLLGRTEKIQGRSSEIAGPDPLNAIHLKTYGNGTHQARYRKECDKMARFVRHFLQYNAPSITNIKELLIILGEWRRRIALLCRDMAFRDMGDFRKAVYSKTPFKGPYQEYGDRLKKTLQMPCTIVGTTFIDGAPKDVALTEMDEGIGWIHTRGKCYYVAEVHTHRLLVDLWKMDPQMTRVDDLRSGLGDGHWWFCQWMPYARGSATIATALFNGFWLYPGYEPPAAVRHLDLDALSMTRETFIPQYPGPKPIE